MGGTKRWIALVVTGALALAACSDDAPTSEAAAASSSTTEDVTSTTVETTTTTEATTTTTTEPEPVVEGSRGCGTKPDAPLASTELPPDVEQTITSDGVERGYRLSVPPGYDPDEPVPLVLNLHGSGSNALQASIYGDVPRRANERGWVVATPDAINNQWELGDGPDDTFLVGLTDDLLDRYCIDLAHVHMVGMSLGAWKSAFTTCRHADRYAAMGLVTVEVFPGECQPKAMVAFHGTADPTVPYDTGPGGGTAANMVAWADAGKCDPKPRLTTIGSDVEVSTYRNCADGVDVVLHTIDGGGHTWPGSDIDIAAPEMTTHTIDATEILLDFLEKHPLQPPA